MAVGVSDVSGKESCKNASQKDSPSPSLLSARLCVFMSRCVQGREWISACVEVVRGEQRETEPLTQETWDTTSARKRALDLSP